MELKITDKTGKELFVQKGKELCCCYDREYNEGDKIIITAPETEFLKIKLDAALKESIIYAPSGKTEFEIPFGRLKEIYAEDAFSGATYKIFAAEPTDEEKYGQRLISLNSHDVRGQKKYYPHAYANLVTRDDVQFFERNAIDGVCSNEGHGPYPYHSWAAGAREDLEYYIDFGIHIGKV